MGAATGKVVLALVTGGGPGIGAAIARTLAAAGAVAWLLSAAASYVNGTTPVDGVSCIVDPGTIALDPASPST